MAVSVRMDPVLEHELEAAARRKGQTKSQFIVDAVERALGRKNPYELLLQVQEEMAEYKVNPQHAVPAAAKGGATKERVRAVLAEKHGKLQSQFAEDHPKPVTRRGARGK